MLKLKETLLKGLSMDTHKSKAKGKVAPEEPHSTERPHVEEHGTKPHHTDLRRAQTTGGKEPHAALPGQDLRKTQSSGGLGTAAHNHSGGSFGSFNRLPHLRIMSFSGHHEHSKSWQVLETLACEPGFRYDKTQFELIRQIGSGAFGRVLLCRHTLTGQKVVLKTIAKKHIRKAKQCEHLREEKDALKLLSTHRCPFVVHAVGCFQDRESVYFVMEYVSGGELFAHLRASPNHCFSEKRARFYVAEIILALQHMHEHEHLVYRDIKPENMLLDEEGHVRIIDFGFAKHLDEAERTYTFCGTPDYLAPEIIKGSGYGRETDYWALGVLIYELTVGHAPFMTVDPRTGRARYDDVLMPSVKFPKGLSAQVVDLVLALLQVDPSQRLGSHGGWEEIKAHPWFSEIDWGALLRGEIKPPKLHKVKHGTINIQGDPKKYRLPRAGGPPLSEEAFRNFEFTIRSNSENGPAICEEDENPKPAPPCTPPPTTGGLAMKPTHESSSEGENEKPQFFI